MPQHVVILGRGKLATALERIFANSFSVVKLTREQFDAKYPESVNEHLKASRPAYVFNTVVSGGLDACAQYPTSALAINTLFPLHLAKLTSQLDFTLVHFSTDSVFGDEPTGRPRVESSLAMPPNMYGYTKFGADTLIPIHAKKYLIYRLPVVFGPSPVPSQFLERMIDRLPSGASLRIAADVFSHAVYSVDVARTIKNHLKEGPKPGLYHLAGEEKASLYELVATAAALLGYPNEIQQASEADFSGLDYKNRNIHLASEKIPQLRSWRVSLRDYCGILTGC